MNKNEANAKLKQLMQSYEQGMIDYEIYRQRRNDVIDEYAGQEEFIPPRRVAFDDGLTNQPKHHKASSATTILTLVLVLAAALIAFFAISEPDEQQLRETFVDSAAAPLEDQ
jgi:hypothetical protein